MYQKQLSHSADNLVIFCKNHLEVKLLSLLLSVAGVHASITLIERRMLFIRSISNF